MKFEQELTLNAPPSQVFSFFNNVPQLAGCIPGCGEVRAVDSNRYQAVIADRLGPFQVKFLVEVKIEEMESERLIRATASGKDKLLGSTFNQMLVVRVEPLASGGSRVHLATEVQFLGKIASLGYPIIKRKADEAMKKFSEKVRSLLEQDQAAS